MATNIPVKFYQVDEWPAEPAEAFAWYTLRVGNHYELRVTDKNGWFKERYTADKVVSGMLAMYTIPQKFRFVGMVVLIRSGTNAGKRFKLVNEPGTTATSIGDWQAYTSTEEVDLGSADAAIDYMNNNLQQIN